MGLADIGRVILAIFQTIIAVFFSLYYALENLVLSCIPRSCRRCDVTDKVTLITGAGSGIGRAVAQRLAKRGAKIISWDVNSAGNDETAKLIRDEGGECYTYTVDLCDRHAVYKVAKMVKSDIGKVDILVNNAGIVTGRNFLEAPDEMVLKTFDVNILSHFWTTKAFLPDMMAENNGHVVTIASLAGLFGVNKLVDYCASKFAAVGFNESLRLELYVEGYTGISTTVVCPYYINTGMFDGVKSKLIPILEQEDVADEITDAILMKKRQLIMPTFCSFIFALKGLTAVKDHERLLGALGVSHTMQSFLGREEGKKQKEQKKRDESNERNSKKELSEKKDS